MTVEPMLAAERGTEGSAPLWRSGFRGAPVLPETPVGCVATRHPCSVSFSAATLGNPQSWVSCKKALKSVGGEEVDL